MPTLQNNPQSLKDRILQKYPDGVASDGRKYAEIDPNDLAQMIVSKFPDGVTSDGIKYADFLNPVPEKTFGEKALGVFKGIGETLISSEKGVGETLGQSMAVNSKDFADAQSSAQGLSDMQFKTQKLIQEKKARGEDTGQLESVLAKTMGKEILDINEIAPATQKTNLQALGEVGGVALDTLTFGTYGSAVKGASTGALMAKKVIAPTVEKAVQKSLSQTLKNIGKKTLVRSAEGAATGYSYDVAGNLQQGKTGAEIFTPGAGTIFGATIPVGIGAAQAGTAIVKNQAPRIINSLIKPLLKDFSYGKNPGRAISEMGITGNTFDDLERNVSAARSQIGDDLGKIYDHPELENMRIDLSDDVSKIDKAIDVAAQGGKNNQAVVTRLQNAKDALLYAHTVSASGDIVKVLNPETGSPLMRDISNLSPKEAFAFKKEIGDMTKFTGNASDDKTVNSTLKSLYGGIKDKLNSAITPISPELPKLNERYADLTSAEIAMKYRGIIDQRKNLISMPIKIGGVAGLITAVGTGGAAIPALLAGAGVGLIDKAMESTAFKSRIAAWLGSETPSKVASFFAEHPEIKNVIYRAIPKYASQATHQELQPQSPTTMFGQ